MQRRTALKLLAGAAGYVGLAGAAFGRAGLALAGEEPPRSVIGYSQGGRPLVIYHLGDGPRRVFVLGGQHGGPEQNTIDLAGAVLGWYVARPEQLPPGLRLDIMVVANPDGAVSGSRQFLSGVDPNRNWGGSDWQADAWDSDARFIEGLGGPGPFSEQETRALRDWVLLHRPDLTINYHSRGGFMFGPAGGPGADLAAAYAAASGYHRPQPGGGVRVLGYRATGNMGGWQREQGLAGLFLELSTSTDPEVGRNLAGVRAVLDLLAAGA